MERVDPIVHVLIGLYLLTALRDVGSTGASSRIRCRVPYTRYTSDFRGDVFNERGVRQAGHMDRDGYITLCLVDDLGEKHHMLAHRLIHWTHDPDFDIYDLKLDVDHRDGCPQNNRPDNLKHETRPAHIAKTVADNPERFAKMVAKIKIELLYTCPDTGEVFPYESKAMAMAKTGISEQDLRLKLGNGCGDWTYVKKPVAGEFWYSCASDAVAYWKSRGKPKAAQVQVSNLGRVRRGVQATFGSPGAGGHLMYGGVQVSWLIAVVWLGPPPCAGLRVRHLDGNCSNNCHGNLLWSSSNTSSVPPRCWGVPTLDRGALGRDVANRLIENICDADALASLALMQPVEVSANRMASAFANVRTSMEEDELRETRLAFGVRGHNDYRICRRIFQRAFGFGVVRTECQHDRLGYDIIALIPKGGSEFSNRHIKA